MKRYKLSEPATSRTWLEIDIGILKKNLEIIKRSSGNKKVMAVIKADAYGHGAERVAFELREYADMFCVASPEEALLIRRIPELDEKPILVLGGISAACSPQCLIVGNITLTVFDTDSARLISQAAVRSEKTAKIFIAVDTGMSRIGVPCDKHGVETVIKISQLPNLKIDGIFTHLAKADETDKSSAKMQVKLFNEFTDQLKNAGVCYGMTSVSNSAAAIGMKIEQDIIRAGIAMYGICPSDETPLPRGIRPALSMRSRVEQVKTVPAGTGVSYGHTYVTERETVLATVYCGYADGYPRSLSGKGRVIIRGRYAPIVGRICMDQLIIDVTGIEKVKKGDIVTLIGKDGSASIPAEEIAELAGTIPYEILTGLSTPRVSRIYF